MKSFQNQLREIRKASKKSEKYKKKPPSIEINYRELNNNLASLNDTGQSKSLLKKYLNPNKVAQNKSSSLIKRFAIELGKGKFKTESKGKNNLRKNELIGNIDTSLLIKSILSNETTISPKSPTTSNFRSSLNRSLKKHKNSNIGNIFNMTGNFTSKKRGKINLNKSNAKSKDKLCKNADVGLLARKPASKQRDKSTKRNHAGKCKLCSLLLVLSTKREGSPCQNKYAKEKVGTGSQWVQKLSIDVDPKAFTMNKGDLKKLTQEIKLEEKSTLPNQNKSQLVVQDVSKYSESINDSEITEPILNYLADQSEDKLETESETTSVK